MSEQTPTALQLQSSHHHPVAFLWETPPWLLPHQPSSEGKSQGSSEHALRPVLRDSASSERGETAPSRMENTPERGLLQGTEQRVRRAPDLPFHPEQLGKAGSHPVGYLCLRHKPWKAAGVFQRCQALCCLPGAQPLSRGTLRTARVRLLDLGRQDSGTTQLKDHFPFSGVFIGVPSKSIPSP